MAWTSPRTWTTAEIVTASIMNTHVRDNFDETVPAKATAADQFFVATGANAIERRITGQSNVNTLETTTSTSYTDLATVGPATTITTGTRALVLLTANLWNDTANQIAIMAYAVSGATTASASDNTALYAASDTGGQQFQMSWGQLRTGLTAGSNTFTAKYRVISGTGNFRRRFITIIPL